MSSKPPRRPSVVVDNDELLPPDEAAEKITGFFASLGDESTVAVSVYAIDPKNRLKGRSFLFELPNVAELTGPQLMTQVLEKFGPGEYLAEGRDSAGKLCFSPRFTVGPLKPARVEIPAPAAVAIPGTTGSSTSPELLAILQNQTKLLEALVSQHQRPPPSLADQLREFKDLREIFAPAPAPAFDLGKLVETVSGVLKLRDELDVGGGAENPLGVFARALAPALGKIVDKTLEQPAPPPAAPPASTTTAETPPPAAGADMGIASDMMLRTYVGQLVALAEQGGEPKAAAERVIGTLAGFSEKTIAIVLDWLDDDALVDKLAAVDPRARQYAGWLEQVVDLVLDAATEEESPPAASSTNGAPAAPAN